MTAVPASGADGKPADFLDAVLGEEVASKREKNVAMRRILAAMEDRDDTAAYRSMQRFFARSLAYLDCAYPEVMARPVAWSDSDL